MANNIEECSMCWEYKQAAMKYVFSGGYQDVGYLCYDCAEEVLVLFNAADILPIPDDEVE